MIDIERIIELEDLKEYIETRGVTDPVVASTKTYKFNRKQRSILLYLLKMEIGRHEHPSLLQRFRTARRRWFQ